MKAIFELNEVEMKKLTKVRKALKLIFGSEGDIVVAFYDKGGEGIMAIEKQFPIEIEGGVLSYVISSHLPNHKIDITDYK